MRTLRGARDLVSRLVALATVGLLLLFGFGEVSDAFISPGPLSVGHAHLACQDCHVGAEGGVAAMPHIEFGEQGCLGCHPFDDVSDAPLVHSLSGPVLVAAHARAQDSIGDASLGLAFARWLSPPPGPGEEMKCSTCHVEHGGVFDAPHLKDESCQVCHSAPFRSFSEGHPEFRDLPARPKVRSPIAFDHSSHAGLMFPARGMKLECSHCHWPAEDGVRIEIADYQYGCAECHAKDVAPEALGPLILFELPQVDPTHFPYTDWPESREDNRPGKFSPGAVQQLLLGHVKGVVDAGARFDKRLARSSKEEGQRVVEELAAVLLDARSEDIGVFESALRGRIAAAVTLEEGELDYAALGGEELRSAFARAGSAWFGGGEAHEAEVSSSFQVDSQAFRIEYHPSGHADPVLRAWLPLMARVYQSQKFRGAFSDRWFAACTKCHNASSSGGAPLNIEWAVRERTPLGGHGLSRFAHGPHLAAFPGWANDEGMWPSGNCQTCHPTLVDVEERSGFFAYSKGAAIDPSIVVKEFAPLTRDGCAACHGAGVARDSCLTCHIYHAQTQGAQGQD